LALTEYVINTNNSNCDNLYGAVT